MSSKTWVLGVALASISCSSPLDISLVAVEVTGEPLVRPDRPVEIQITATNVSDRRIVWGMGSSSCQLGLVLVFPGGTRFRADARVCTGDLIEQGLDPGQTRTETVTWAGEFVRDGGVASLAAGRYRLIGIAGDQGESREFRVTVER